MKFLVIIISHEFSAQWRCNLILLKHYMDKLGAEVDYCGISSENDFDQYADIFTFRFKIVDKSDQIMKLCNFISTCSAELDYDWYIKMRPDIKFLQDLPFETLLPEAVNARARVYRGPRRIKYGMSVNGEGIWKDIGNCDYDETERTVVLDDQFFVFGKSVKDRGAFKCVNEAPSHEWRQTEIFVERNIPLNVIGIHLELCKYKVFSGNLN